MTKKFIKDNRGQVLYAVIVTVMFMGVLSMIAMGLTLQHYRAAEQKQAHVTDYYAADAAAEMLRKNGSDAVDQVKSDWKIDEITFVTEGDEVTYTITCGTATIKTKIDTVNQEFKSWEVSYHAENPAS